MKYVRWSILFRATYTIIISTRPWSEVALVTEIVCDDDNCRVHIEIKIGAI